MSKRPALPLAQAVLGLTLFASIALPLTQGGLSLLDVLLRLLSDSLVVGLTFLLTIASPQLFGLAVAGAWFMRDEQRARGLVQIPLAFLQGNLFLIGVSLAGSPRVVASYALLGFAVITSGYFLYASAEAEARAEDPARGGLSLRWCVRWGALLIAGLGAWLRLQSLRGLGLGLAGDVATVTAVLLLASTARRQPRIA